MRRIGSHHPEPLYSVEATRAIEHALTSALPPFALMTRAGTATAQLARSLAPHARRIWIACGPGNNGGDGLVAARHLHEARHTHPGAAEVVVTLCCTEPGRLPEDAARALAEALAAGVCIAHAPPDGADLVIDALLGIGARNAPSALIAEHLLQMHALACPVLAVDVPSGLMADTGVYLGPAPHTSNAPRHTLSLLTLKPGLFTADGRDLAGTVWFDPLEPHGSASPLPVAQLFGQDGGKPTSRSHATHKGSQGDVVVIGGQDITQSGAGMTGAAILAARAALHAGAGRVYVGLLGDHSDAVRWDPLCPELMFRRSGLLAQARDLMADATVVCGCGGGTAVADVLPVLLSSCVSLVLDADALNHLAEDPVLQTLMAQRQTRGVQTVITPHPLEAARLLGTGTREVMGDRLQAATALSLRFGVTCVLKGSGTVVAAPGQTPHINSSGNPALATAGTGDVLAGWIGSLLTQARRAGSDPLTAVLAAVFAHGHLADQWVAGSEETLTAHRLAMGIGSAGIR
ncbi:NAD(P)H-hydrate dehydratase [Hydrogenophaga sp. RWCD_12]|uniref:NAD(P)H-hydrate dehydratase n=1 Tax=Hydrogenophaga sp. RWCD_12 TaxID=3391190 RepID=UPI00398473BA